MYRRLDVAAWLHHLNALGQVEEEYKLRKVRPGASAGPAASRPGVGAAPTGRCLRPGFGDEGGGRRSVR